MAKKPRKRSIHILALLTFVGAIGGLLVAYDRYNKRWTLKAIHDTYQFIPPSLYVPEAS